MSSMNGKIFILNLIEIIIIAMQCYCLLLAASSITNLMEHLVLRRPVAIKESNLLKVVVV